jgi:aminoglycoside 6'-N-acetyltransferase
MSLPELSGARVKLRPAATGDIMALAQILAEPEVARWWGPYDVHRVESELVSASDNRGVFVIEFGGRCIGGIQFSEEAEPQYRHADIDLFLSSQWHGQGLGPEAISLVVTLLFEQRGHHRIVIDPAADNTRAVKAYEKAGFCCVGLMRQYECGPNGTWHDGVLMELLRDPS